ATRLRRRGDRAEPGPRNGTRPSPYRSGAWVRARRTSAFRCRSRTGTSRPVGWHVLRADGRGPLGVWVSQRQCERARVGVHGRSAWQLGPGTRLTPGRSEALRLTSAFDTCNARSIRALTDVFSKRPIDSAVEQTCSTTTRERGPTRYE